MPTRCKTTATAVVGWGGIALATAVKERGRLLSSWGVQDGGENVRDFFYLFNTSTVPC